MKRSHLIAGAAAVAAVAGGTAGAIAATSDDKAAEKTVLTDAAKTLGVSPEDLRSALANAEDAQIDAAVKAGKLTQAQADEIKKHRADEGTVLGFGHGGPGFRGPGGPGFGGPHGGPLELFSAAAKALGITESELMKQLRAGKTPAAIAKANGKSLADVKAAVKQAATDQLDADVKAGRITKAQRDDALSELDEHLDDLGDLHFGGGPGRFGDHHGYGPPPGMPGPPPPAATPTP